MKLKIEGDDIVIPRQPHYIVDSFIDGTIMTLADAPWPGLTPDLLSVLIVVATQARGSVLVHQKMFESRLFFVDKLIDMGSTDNTLRPTPRRHHRPRPQETAARRTHDQPRHKAGIALLIAALGAKGTSRIENIAQIDRGYEDIEQRLNNLGAHIRRGLLKKKASPKTRRRHSQRLVKTSWETETPGKPRPTPPKTNRK